MSNTKTQIRHCLINSFPNKPKVKIKESSKKKEGLIVTMHFEDYDKDDMEEDLEWAWEQLEMNMYDKEYNEVEKIKISFTE